jgi:aspartate aminotransferase
MAFQGLASGDAARDAQPVRFMAHEGLPVVLCQSFDAVCAMLSSVCELMRVKMMGLYADSPALVSVVTRSGEAKERVDSQLRATARTLHLHPSPWGARVVHSILSDVKLYPAW